jgi:hypothetical protein
MMRWGMLVTAFVAAVGTGSAAAQTDLPIARPSVTRPLDDPKPVYKYELKPEHGEFLVVVHTFRGSVAAGDRQAKELAEGFAEWIRTERKLYAYVYERGWALRRERDKEKEAVIDAIRKYCTAQGESELQIAERIRKEVKLARIPDEYAVVVLPGQGTLKTLNETADFAKYIHKLPCPPAEFCDAIVVGASSGDIARRQGEAKNPFLTAMPGRNLTLPKKETAIGNPKAIQSLINMNRGKPYSLTDETKKPFTLVVQTYGSKFGVGKVLKPGEKTDMSAKANGELLERAAQQAVAVAKILREQKHEAYVLHTEFESFVCIGEYDSKDDARLLANAKAFAFLQLRDDKKGTTMETFMEKPMPAMIPRP